MRKGHRPDELVLFGVQIWRESSYPKGFETFFRKFLYRCCTYRAMKDAYETLTIVCTKISNNQTFLSTGYPLTLRTAKHKYYVLGFWPLHSQLEAVLDPLLHYSRLRFVRSAKHIMHVCCLLDLRRRASDSLPASSPFFKMFKHVCQL